VFSGREQLAVIRPLDGVLTMAMLNYDAEIRKPSEIKSEFTRPRTAAAKLRLAEDLISKWQDGSFDFASYKDNYRRKVKEAIAAKKKGIKIEPPEEDEESEVINIMDALKRSVANDGKKSGARTSAGKSRRRHATATRRHKRA
jgi:DNA end-binding protein Ku